MQGWHAAVHAQRRVLSCNSHLDGSEVGAATIIVDRHVHAHIEEVLVDLCIQARRHEHPIVGQRSLPL